MAFSVTMPALGESVSEGTVTRWLKSEGDSVALDEPLLEVSTDKVDTEIPSPVAGVLERIVVSEDETVQVGAELALISDAAAAPDAGAPADTVSQNGSDPAASSADGSASADQNSSANKPGAHRAPEPEVGEGIAPYGGTPSDEPAQASAPAPSETAPASSNPTGSDPEGPVNGTPVVLPALGESVTEGTVTRWLKSVGDSVEVDEPLLEVSTDKVDTEIPSPVAGTLLSIDVPDDTTVAVGAQLALIGQPSGAEQTGANGSAPLPSQRDSGPVDVPQQATADSAPRPAAPAPVEPAPTQASAPPAPSAAASTAPTPAAPVPSAPVPSTSTPSGAAPSASGAPSSSTAGEDNAAYVTPLVRRLAADSGVDLSTVTGTGVGGRIRKQDVLDAAARAKAAPTAGGSAPASSAPSPSPVQLTPSPQRGTREKMSRLRKVIAERMVESLQTSAQLTTVVEVDLTRVAALRDRAKRDFEAREGVKLSFLPFLAKATIEALKAHAKLNASIAGDEIIYHDAEHLGIAVDTERGLLVPVIKDAGDLNIAGLSRRIADLAERTRANKVTPDELGGGTFTLTNTGSRGALFDTPILNQPQVGILGTGTVVKRPVVVSSDLGDTIAIRSMMYLALSYDHRIVDGADAARFLGAVKARLEEGAFTGDLGL